MKIFLFVASNDFLRNDDTNVVLLSGVSDNDTKSMANMRLNCVTIEVKSVFLTTEYVSQQ